MHQLPNEAVTHNGRFHADDVFSAALLEILNPRIHMDITVRRSRQSGVARATCPD